MKFFSFLRVWKGFWEGRDKINIVGEGKILLLDDNKDLLLIVQIILKGQGYETVQAGCIDEARQKIKIHKPSLILMDVFIKEEDGRELCSQLKRSDETNAIKIIMMSGIESDNSLLQAIGADDFMQKPFDYNDLLERVQRQMMQVEA
jgi:two-component system response regulator VicR